MCYVSNLGTCTYIRWCPDKIPVDEMTADIIAAARITLGQKFKSASGSAQYCSSLNGLNIADQKAGKKLIGLDFPVNFCPHGLLDSL